MSSKRSSKKSNFKPRPQVRPVGIGAGREMFQWAKLLPWLLIAAEQLYVAAAGSEGAILEDRDWKKNWDLGGDRLAAELEHLYPGLNEYLLSCHSWNTPWQVLLANRVYKMFYNGSSARGFGHDPRTRPSLSKEHWRNKNYRVSWEATVVREVFLNQPVLDWRSRLT